MGLLGSERVEEERIAAEQRKKEEEEYQERLRKLEEQAEKQKQREREIEEREAKRREEAAARRGDDRPAPSREADGVWRRGGDRDRDRDRDRLANLDDIYKACEGAFDCKSQKIFFVWMWVDFEHCPKFMNILQRASILLTGNKGKEKNNKNKSHVYFCSLQRGRPRAWR